MTVVPQATFVFSPRTQELQTFECRGGWTDFCRKKEELCIVVGKVYGNKKKTK